MSVNLVPRRLEQRLIFSRIGRSDVLRLHHPNTDAFLATRIKVTGVFDSRPCIDRVQAAHMLMIEPTASANEDFIQRPVAARCHETSAWVTDISVATPLIRARCLAA